MKQQTAAELDIQLGDGSVAVGGSITDSAIIHGQTIVLADRFWRDLQPALPADTIKQATAAYLTYLTDRHYYLSLKGMGVSDRIPLKLKLLDLYVPLKARMELPEGETWKRDLSLAGRDVAEYEDSLHFGDPDPLLDVLKSNSGVIAYSCKINLVIEQPNLSNYPQIKIFILQKFSQSLTKDVSLAIVVWNRLVS